MRMASHEAEQGEALVVSFSFSYEGKQFNKKSTELNKLDGFFGGGLEFLSFIDNHHTRSTLEED